MHAIHYIRHLRQEEGGVVRAVLDLTNALARAGTQVTLLTGPAEATESEQGGLRIVPVDLPPASLWARFSTSTKSDLEKLLKTGDVLHLHTLWDPLNLPFAKLATELGLPYMVSTHGMLDDWALRFKPFKKNIYLRLVGQRLLRGAYRLHTTAEGESRQVQQRVPGAETFVAPLCIDLEAFGSLPGPELAQQKYPLLQRPDPKVLFLSRLHPIKGVELLIDAVAQLPTNITPLLVIAGPGDPSYVAEVERQVADRSLADRTIFAGMVSGELKHSLYQACDLFVHPSQQENFGLVFAEAMACGTPIVTTDQVDAATELAAGGAIVVPRSVEALSGAIIEALSDPQGLARRGEHGHEYVRQWLDIDRVVARYNELYRAATTRDV